MSRNFKDFKEFIKGKKVAVVGIGVSNTPLVRMLVSLGANIVACDKKVDLGDIREEFENLGVEFSLGKDYLDGILNSDVVFRTPSLLPTNEFLVRAKANGAYITSEMEEFLKYCKGKIFGITGSDGKTTTTTLVAEMLKKEGKNVFLGGNIGTPLFNKIEEIKEEDFVVVELSSFQLMGCVYSPEISLITNLSPNHLDYHKDMDEYVDAKRNIFSHQGENGIVVLNADNEITRSMKDEVKGEVRLFSRLGDSGFAVKKDGKLYVNEKEVCRADEIKLIGEHNIENFLAAFSAVYGYVSIESMREVATKFLGIPHRIEFVRELNGIKFYNNSIASSPSRTLAGLKSFKEKLILIAGGYDKNLPFDTLAHEGLDRIKLLIVMGNTKIKIKTAFEEAMKDKNMIVPIAEASSLEEAIKIGYEYGEKGDIVIMSPACASFDMFKNFEERGNKFKELVNSLQ